MTNHLSQYTVKSEADVTRESELGEDNIVKDSLRVYNARLVVTIFETAYAEWKELGEGNGCPRPRGLERFDRGMFFRHTYTYSIYLYSNGCPLTGHVLTRIVQKGAEALGVLKDYGRELEVLNALLNQRRWRRGRRGKWYERRALVLTRYGDKSPETLRGAMRGLIDSLNDPDTHLGGCISFRPQQLQLITPMLSLPPESIAKTHDVGEKNGHRPRGET